MRNIICSLTLFLFTLGLFAQAGHIMQGVGAVNMSMGGAATGNPLDISGAIHWNPAGLSAFDEDVLKLDIGLFFSSPELSSTVPLFDPMGNPTGEFFSGVTEDDRGLSPLPALAYVWSNEESSHTWGVSAFGISGFGVTFPESMTNPINFPQSMGGFGRVESDYSLLQLSFSWAYELSETLSVGLQPNFNYASLELIPNPTANPNQSGYPSADRASTTGFGGQVGLYFDSGSGFKAGAAYKTEQFFSEFDLDNTYLDGSMATNSFKINYPAMFSVGLGYTAEAFDIALDYRFVDYENADGFSETGWTPTASVAGFGWKNISIISAGFQYKGIDRFPVRVGYTYSSNPIDSDVAFFNIPATAIIENAFQLGFTYDLSEAINIDAVYHYGTSSGDTSGPLLNPMLVGPSNPFGAFPGSEVSYDMTTSMIQFGASYTFGTGGDQADEME